MLLLLIFLLFPSLSSSERCHPQDKAALLKIKNAFSNSPELFSISPDIDCCNIFQCDETTNRVIYLSFAQTNVSGNIPDAVGDLPYLKKLRFYKMPFLVGDIPRSISKLKYLRTLHIIRTNVSGPVPHFLSELQDLWSIDLSFNNLSGSIPPSIATLPNLWELDLSHNKLTGRIPGSFDPLNSIILYLSLSHNMLSGEIPKSLAKLKFYTVDVSHNNLSGDALMFFTESNCTGQLDISRNNFEFDFSKVRFCDELFRLDMSHNRIYGSIPSQITEAVYLLALNVSYNRLCGEIPTGWKLRRADVSFDNSSFVHNRCLCGPPLDECTV